MKRISYLLILMVVILVFSGCGKKSEIGQGEESSQLSKEKSVGVKVVNSIKDVMGLGQKMECTYTTDINGKTTPVITQLDGKNFKSSSEIDGKKMFSLMKDEVMYTWGEGIPMASKFKLSCMKDLEKDMPKAEGEESQLDNFKNPEKSFDDATNVACKPIASVDLSTPDDIQFQDMCEMLKGFSNMKIPGGSN